MTSKVRISALAANRRCSIGLMVMLVAGSLVSTGCVQRHGGLAGANSSYPTSDDSTVANVEALVEAAELALLADRLGLGGSVPVVVSRPRIATAPRNRQRSPFVQVNRNGTFPGGRGGNGTFVAGNGSFPQGSGNGTFAAGAMGNGTFANGGGRGTFPQGQGNTTFGAGAGNGDGRFVPIRRGGASTFPIENSNTTFGPKK